MSYQILDHETWFEGQRGFYRSKTFDFIIPDGQSSVVIKGLGQLEGKVDFIVSEIANLDTDTTFNVNFQTFEGIEIGNKDSIADNSVASPVVTNCISDNLIGYQDTNIEIECTTNQTGDKAGKIFFLMRDH